MQDLVMRRFLERQLQLCRKLNDSSDLLEVIPEDKMLPMHYLAHFTCKGLIRNAQAEVVEAESFFVGIWFPETYLQRSSHQVVAWRGPHSVFHPNIQGPARAICIGDTAPGTELDQLVEQCFQVITYQKLTMREDDALDPVACAWARRHIDRFPIDPRPLRRQAPLIKAELVEELPNHRR